LVSFPIAPAAPSFRGRGEATAPRSGPRSHCRGWRPSPRRGAALPPRGGGAAWQQGWTGQQNLLLARRGFSCAGLSAGQTGPVQWGRVFISTVL